MAAQGPDGKSAEAICSGKEKINLNHFCDILQDISSDRDQLLSIYICNRLWDTFIFYFLFSLSAHSFLFSFQITSYILFSSLLLLR